MIRLPSEVDIVVERDGRVRMIYNEFFEPSSIGEPSIRRGSHVEPDVRGEWWADLSPVEGPRLGPFPKRSDAIEAEIRWLVTNWL